MFKVGLIGVMSAILAVLIKKDRAELSVVLSMAAGMVIFFYILSQVAVVFQFVTGMVEMADIEKTYFFQLLKMLGVAYVAEFASSICKDAGHQSIAGMIELFAKLSIVALSIPGLTFLLETLGEFL